MNFKELATRWEISCKLTQIEAGYRFASVEVMAVNTELLLSFEEVDFLFD
jgi:hypothetical protein